MKTMLVRQSLRGKLMKVFKKQMKSTLDALRKIEEEISVFLKSNGVPEDDLYYLKLSVHEAILNILEHSYRWDPSKEVDVIVSINGGMIEVRIRDYGPPVPEEVKNFVNPDRSYVGGLGMKFMRTFLSDIYYEDVDEGNELVMKKLLSEVAN